jgi:hypothetical protein
LATVDVARLAVPGATEVRVSRFSLSGTPFGDMYAAVAEGQLRPDAVGQDR